MGVIMRGKIILLIISFTCLGALHAQEPSVQSGEEVYRENCISCHGEKGRVEGDAPHLTGRLKEKSSEELFVSITDGVPGTSMPAWGDNLTEGEKWDVIAYFWTFWANRERVERGKVVYGSNCAPCHGKEGGGIGLEGAFNFTAVNKMRELEPVEFYEIVTNGSGGNTPMPAWKGRLTAEERWDVVKYAWTFHFEDYPAESAGVKAGVPGDEEEREEVSPGGEEREQGWPYGYCKTALTVVSAALVLVVIYFLATRTERE